MTGTDQHVDSLGPSQATLRDDGDRRRPRSDRCFGTDGGLTPKRSMGLESAAPKKTTPGAPPQLIGIYAIYLESQFVPRKMSTVVPVFKGSCGTLEGPGTWSA